MVLGLWQIQPLTAIRKPQVQYLIPLVPKGKDIGMYRCPQQTVSFLQRAVKHSIYDSYLQSNQ